MATGLGLGSTARTAGGLVGLFSEGFATKTLVFTMGPSDELAFSTMTRLQASVGLAASCGLVPKSCCVGQVEMKGCPFAHVGYVYIRYVL